MPDKDNSALLDKAYGLSAITGRITATVSFCVWSLIALALVLVGWFYFNPSKYSETSVQVEDNCSSDCSVRDTQSERQGKLLEENQLRKAGTYVTATYKSNTAVDGAVLFYPMTLSEMRKYFYALIVGVPLLWVFSLLLLILTYKSKRVAAGVGILSVFG